MVTPIGLLGLFCIVTCPNLLGRVGFRAVRLMSAKRALSNDVYFVVIHDIFKHFQSAAP